MLLLVVEVPPPRPVARGGHTVIERPVHGGARGATSDRAASDVLLVPREGLVGGDELVHLSLLLGEGGARLRKLVAGPVQVVAQLLDFGAVPCTPCTAGLKERGGGGGEGQVWVCMCEFMGRDGTPNRPGEGDIDTPYRVAPPPHVCASHTRSSSKKGRVGPYKSYFDRKTYGLEVSN